MRENIFMWLDIELVGLPERAKDEFYGDTYSVPVLAANKFTGQVFDVTVVYNYDDGGWCYTGLSDGPNPGDYEVPSFTHFTYLPTI